MQVKACTVGQLRTDSDLPGCAELCVESFICCSKGCRADSAAEVLRKGQGGVSCSGVRLRRGCTDLCGTEPQLSVGPRPGVTSEAHLSESC